MERGGAVPLSIPPEQAGAAAELGRLTGAEAVETHISALFRGADVVFKMKKAVRLGFLDFTRVEDRRRFLGRELELNGRFAPGLYRDVVEVAGEPVLRMARVPEGDFLDEVAARGGVDGGLLDGLTDAVAGMHAGQEPSGLNTQVGRLRRVAEGNAGAARDAGIDAGVVGAWLGGLMAALEGAGAALEARAPLVRRAHGDLHLGNLLLWRGRPAPFDALEFDEELATIDPGYDLAFLLMDLERLVGRGAANRVLCRYVARTGDAGLVAGLPAFLSLRAMIRAHVEAVRGRPYEGLVEAALGYLRPRRAVLMAVGGLMGTGKSTLARAVAPGLGGAPGALVLRSDEVRKRLHGVGPEDRLGAEGYTREAHARTGAAMIAAAGVALRGGHAVVLDATFLDAGQAAAAGALAEELGVGFLGVWLEAPLAELERRVAGRRGDASDADVGVLRAAAARAVPPAGWVRVAAGDLADVQGQVQRRLDLL